LLHAILEELPSKDDLVLSEGESSIFPLEGVQHGDVHHPCHDYTVTRGDPGVPDHTNEATADHYTNTPP
jgi:hypothetical protein